MRIKKGTPEEDAILKKLTEEIRQRKVHHRKEYYSVFGITRSQFGTLNRRAKERIRWEETAGRECAEMRERLAEKMREIGIINERIESENNSHEDQIRTLDRALDDMFNQMAKLAINNQKLRTEISALKK